MVNQTELEQLKAQIAQLEKYFHKEIAYLRERVAVIELEAEMEENVIEMPVKEELITPIAHEEKVPTLQEILLKFQQKEREKTTQEDLGKESAKTHKTEQKVHEQRQKKTKEEFEREKQEHKREEYKKEEVEWEIPAFVTDLFVPLAQFRDLLTRTYQHYKEQNRLPVFFMTLGGVIAILLGFSYLMQFIPDVYFEVFKVGGSFLASFGILFGGLVLMKKEAKYHEFGSALLGLSVAVNFLILYYLSDSTIFPVFANPIFSFVLILLNTVFAKWIALRYETKIVLTISLLGGVFSPFYLNSPTIPIFYFVYLWLLCVAAIYIAAKIKWQIAEFLVFITASTALEIALGRTNNAFAPIVYVLIISAFAYFFFYVSLFENRKPKANLERMSIGVLVGATGLLLLNLYWIYEPLGQRFSLGLAYLANASAFVVGYFAFRKQLSDKMQVLFFILIGTFVGLAIPAMLERNLKGIFWAIEGIALVFCGFNFRLKGVRFEGYLVLLLAFVQIAISFGEILDNWGLRLWTDGFINLLSLGVIFGAMKLLLNHYQSVVSGDTDKGMGMEQRISYWLSEALPLWLGFAIWIPCYFHLREMTFNLGILGLYGFTWWGLKNNLKVTEWFGLLHLGLMVLGIIESVTVVGSYIFPFQTPMGKGAIIEVFLSMWLLQFFYEKVKKESETMPLMQLLREVFYLAVPLLNLSYVNRVYPEYLPVALWGSVLIGFVLNQFVNRIALLVEIHVVTVLATLGLFRAMDNLLIGYLSAGAGLAVLFGILLFKKGFLLENAKTSAYKFLFTYSFYFLGLCLWLYYSLLTSHGFTADPDFAGIMVVVGLYFFLLTYFREKIAPLHNNFILAYRIGTIAGVIGLAIAFIDKELAWNVYGSDFEHLTFALMLGMVSLFSLMVYQKEKRYPIKSEPIWQADLYLGHIFIALVYSSLIGFFFPNWTGVWLTVVLILHAIILLFNSNTMTYSPLLRLSIAYFVVAFVKLFWSDMAGFETVQKVVVFMVIGVLMLVGSYLFMRFREKK